MKVRIIRTIPGRAAIGEVLDVPAGEGRLLIRAGKALPQEDEPVREDRAVKEVTKRGRRDSS